MQQPLHKKNASVLSERQYIKLHANQNLVSRSKRRGSDLEILATNRSTGSSKKEKEKKKREKSKKKSKSKENAAGRKTAANQKSFMHFPAIPAPKAGPHKLDVESEKPLKSASNFGMSRSRLSREMNSSQRHATMLANLKSNLMVKN